MQLIITVILITFLYYCNAGNILQPPTLVYGGGSKRIQQGGDLTLRCIFSSTPAPTVKWTKDGRVIQTPRTEYFSTYRISNADGDDNGEYICEGRNSEGVGSTSFTVVVETVQTQTNRRIETHRRETTTLPTTPAVVTWEIPEASLEVREPGYYSSNFQQVVYVGQGRPLTMFCRATGGSPQPATLQWYKGSYIIQRGGSEYRDRYFSSSDEAIYRCVASNDAGSHSISVDVRLGAPLAITRAPESRYHRVGTSLILRVTLSRQTDYVISWYRIVDNSLIKMVAGNGIYFQSNNKRMDIVPLRVEHAGDYLVRAVNQEETSSSNFSIYMHAVLTTAQPRGNTPYVVGIILELPCAYYAHPEPIVTWYYGSQTLDPSLSNIFNLSKANTLRIGPLGEGQDGVRIVCRIEDNGIQRQIVYTLELGVRPEIQTTNCDTDLCRGDSVKLKCEATSDAPLTYSWYKETDPNTRITPSSKYKLYSNGKLTIVNSSLNDVGTYICRASNKYSSDSIACRVQATPGVRIASREQRILKTVGTSARIYCLVYGALEAEITWYKDENQDIPQDVVISKQQYNGLAIHSILSFSTINKQHTGEYTCVVSSCASDLRQTHQLSVRQNIEITRTVDKFRYCSGDTVAFPCEATGFPEPTIRWYFKGERIISGESGFYVDEQNSLNIINSPSNKSGYYMCNASNPFSWRTFRFWAFFQDTPLPTFRQTEQRLPVLTEDFCLSCLPIPRVMHTYRWYKEDSDITNSTRYNLTNVWQLCITNFQPEDLGNYKCEATNCEGVGEKTFNINSYQDQETAPIISATRREYIVVEGNAVSLRCRASGHPTPSISWYYAENRISSNSHYSLEYLPYLRINNVSRGLHNGRYKCLAENRMGSVFLSISLAVYQVPRLRRITSQYAGLGVTACFDCYLLKGYPVPTVEWTKDGVTIANQERVSINQANNTLCISDVASSDQGAYRCTARNSVGWTYVGARLYVRTCGPLSFRTTLLNHTATVGDLITIQCPIEENLYQCSTRLLWRKASNGAIVTLREDDLRLIGSNLELRVNMSSRGYYQCLAYNNHGSIAQVHKLSVVSPPWEIPFISRQVFRANSEVNINCPIRGVPQPRYSWMLGNSELESRDNFIINNDRITINNAVVSNTGLYSCSGRNPYGQWEVMFEITICGEINVQLTGEDEVEERSWVAFTCSLREETVADSVEFFLGSKRLAVTSQTNRLRYSKPDPNTVELRIWATQEDSGPITCRINTTCGSSERTIRLRVTATDTSKLRVVRTQVTRPGIVFPNCHNQFTLLCPVTGKPRPVYKWYFNDSIIRFNRSPNIVSNRGRKEITVHDPDMNDAGKYRCDATNSQGRIRYTYTVNVQLPYTPSNIQRHTVFEGQTLSLDCNSTLLANREWSKNLRKYSIPNPSLSNDLIFEGVESSNEGVYLCCARSGRNVYTYVHEVRVQI